MEARTTNCWKYGHPEFTFHCHDDVLDVDIKWLTDYIEGSVAQGEVYKPNETFQIGWTTTKIQKTHNNGLIIMEPDWTGKIPFDFVDSLTQTLFQLRRQIAMAESVGLKDEIDFPNLKETGVLCKNIGSIEHGIMGRGQREGKFSGWYLLCRDHDHHSKSVEELEEVSLYELACIAPDIIDFLALPEGVRIVFGGPERIRILLNNEELSIRLDSFLDRTLKRSALE
jgi:hypothetical protein